LALDNTVMPAENRAAKVAFQKEVMQLEADLGACQTIISETNTKLKYIKAAIKRSEQPFGELTKSVVAIENKLKQIGLELFGDSVKSKLDISQLQSPANRIGTIGYEQKYSTSAPTKTHKDSYAIAKGEIIVLKKRVEAVFNIDVKELEDKLIKSGAAYTPGRGYKN
jgi:DNA gyrase/topoisomerase IV subunit A